MPFEIDTGTTLTGARQYVPDWLVDQLPPDATDEAVVRAYAHHLQGAVFNPKKQETALKHVIANWAFLGCLAKEQPHYFNEFWTAYAERIWDAEAA